jgi:hypothetical protein
MMHEENIVCVDNVLCLSSLCAYAETTAVPSAKDVGATAPPKQTADLGTQKATPNSTATTASETTTPQQEPKCPDSKKCSGWLWVIALIPSGMFVLLLLFMKSSLKDKNWNLGDALSESETLKDKNGDILMDSNGNPIFAKSASRLIAFVGFFVIIFWLMGMSTPTLYHFACTGEVPKLNDVSTFLIAQAGVFAPYIANKLVSAIK